MVISFYIIHSAYRIVENIISCPSGVGTSTNAADNSNRNFESHTISSDACSTSPSNLTTNSTNPTSQQMKGECLYCNTGCLQFGTRGNGGILFLPAYYVIA